MSDLIDRQAAIDALMPIYKSASLRNRNVFSTARKCMAIIEELPSAQPKRKSGKWEVYVISPFDGEDVRCSECGQCGCAPYWDYCPNCGAEMKGEEE